MKREVHIGIIQVWKQEHSSSYFKSDIEKRPDYYFPQVTVKRALGH